MASTGQLELETETEPREVFGPRLVFYTARLLGAPPRGPALARYEVGGPYSRAISDWA